MILLFCLISNIKINFCNQIIDINTKVIQCNKRISKKEFKKLRYFKKLRILDLGNSNFDNISHLRRLKNLNCLSLENTNIKNLKGIKNLNELLELNIYKTKVNNYDELKFLKNLRIISVDKLSSKLIENLKLLKKLYLIRVLYKPIKKYSELYEFNKLHYKLKKTKVKLIKMVEVNLRANTDLKFQITIIDYLKSGSLIQTISYRNIHDKLYENLFLFVREYLISNNININKLDRNFNSPLDYAIGDYYIYGDEGLRHYLSKTNAMKSKVVEELIKKGALRGRDIVRKKNFKFFKKIYLSIFNYCKKYQKNKLIYLIFFTIK